MLPCINPLVPLYRYKITQAITAPITSKCIIKANVQKELHTSTIWERVIIYIKKVKYNNNKNPSPLIIHFKPRSKSGHAKFTKKSQYQTTLRKIFKNHERATPKSRVNITLCVPSATFSRY